MPLVEEKAGTLWRGQVSEQRALRLDVRRIVVAVDASPHSQAALEAAVELASRFGAELSVLFVEDINVLKTAQLPFVREVGQYSARGSRLEVTRVEQRLRARSRQIRATFEALVARRSVRGSFRVARGVVGAEIRTAAQEADILIVGRAGWSQIRERRLGSTAREVCCSDAPSVTAVLQEGKQIASPIVVVYDGSPVGDRALTLAAALVERLAGSLRVILLTGDASELPALQALAEARLRAFSVEPQVVPVVREHWAAAPTSRLNATLRALEGETLILPSRTSILQDEALLDLIEEIDVPVLIVR
jgi:nucleotide-binding universal stress UspA family protein